MKKKLDLSVIFRSKVTWAVVAEALILLVCLFVRPEFFKISYQPSTGMLYGNIIDIINRSSEITSEYQFGISNEVLPGRTARISVREGRLLLVKVF